MDPRTGRALLAAALAASLARAAAAQDVLSKRDLLSWPRTPADVFGCFLERQFGYKDPKFNCTLTGYKNSGDPCRNTKEYYEGPAFPRNQVQALDKLVSGVDLAWEHGELQAVTLTLDGKLTESRIVHRYGLPKTSVSPRPNVLSYDIQRCGRKSMCLLLTGFEHQGAGESDCPQSSASRGEPEPAAEKSEPGLPKWALERFKKVYGRKLVRFTRVRPSRLVGDFDGDGQPDAAFLVRSREDGASGIAILHASGRHHLLGAGKRFGEWGPDWAWLDAWRLHPRGEPVPGESPPSLAGDAILIEGGPAPGILLYFDSTGYRWHRTRD